LTGSAWPGAGLRSASRPHPANASKHPTATIRFDIIDFE
jgi:hypothetical protein